MPYGAGFDSVNAVVGTFGFIYKEGKWLSQYNKAQASVEITKAEIKPAGDRWVHHKVTALKGTGSISGYKVTDELLKEVSVVAQSEKPSFRTELIFTLEDTGERRGRKDPFDERHVRQGRPGELGALDGDSGGMAVYLRGL